MKNIHFVALLTIVLLLLAGDAFAEEIAFDNLKRGTTETTLFTGIGRNFIYPSANKETFKFDTIGVRFLRQKSPRVAMGYELGSGLELLKKDNSTRWASLYYQRYLRAHKDEALTLDVSVGVMRFKKNVPELGTRTNFIEQLGLTYKWKHDNDKAWFVHLTFSHMSNAGLKTPNIGINAGQISMGHSWYNVCW